MRITEIVVTPVAVHDPPLLNAFGVHQPWALRSVVQLRTDNGLTGLGESYGDDDYTRLLTAAAMSIRGLDPFDLAAIERRIGVTLMPVGAGPELVLGMIGQSTPARLIRRVYAPLEIACLDLQGKATGQPVCTILGGRARDTVPFSAYLFPKWASHPGERADPWGAAQSADQIVEQARSMVGQFGFQSLKLKGGVFAPSCEVETVLALHDAFPDLPLRLDPNSAWTVATSIWVAGQLAGVLEYLEDPTPGLVGMAKVAAKAPMPLATNMCVVDFEHIPEAVRRESVRVVLCDHHYWGGLHACRRLAAICDTFGLGLSMHSNTHLGISLAAMLHLAAATPNLTYACDTHSPWLSNGEDVVADNPLTFVDGALQVPTTPGLGVELDYDALQRLHQNWRHCAVRRRDDTGYMRTVEPAFDASPARW